MDVRRGRTALDATRIVTAGGTPFRRTKEEERQPPGAQVDGGGKGEHGLDGRILGGAPVEPAWAARRLDHASRSPF